MKVPQTPPDFGKALNKLIHDSEKFSRAFRLDATDDRGRYLHWEEFRFKPIPEGLTAIDAWVGTKMARDKQMRQTVFVDKNKRHFRFMETDSIRRLLHHIDSKAHGQIAMPLPLNDKAIGKSFQIASLILEAFSSSRLEGAATTRERAKKIINEGREPRDKSERMVLNNFQAMEFITAHKDDPLSLDMILELHRIVTKGTLDRPEMAGVLRRPEDRIVVEDDEGNVLHEPPPAESLSHRLQLLCDFANHQGEQHEDLKVFVHPIVQAIILHFMIGYDHPFVDGNGRTARALFYWQAVKQHYWLIEYISISNVILDAPIQYGKAYLETETDDNDLTYFILHQLTTIDKAIQELHNHLAKKALDLQKFEGQFSTPAYAQTFNYRQLDVLRKFIEHPGMIIATRDHQNEHGISYQTAKSDLLTLSKRGLVEERKIGKTLAFRSFPDLQERLDKLGDKRELRGHQSAAGKRRPGAFAKARLGTVKS
ncbi:Fic family protein [Dongia sp.]|uniref:Fic family protein n=1 Tax=Dongia sp. TaxID=1977262 RepID=UPI0035B4DE3D